MLLKSSWCLILLLEQSLIIINP
ncbi:unnamed protein product [Spirodela intermedia]|uniref:Uncharacterized protein n=1 Tax=Spirodela intermedia TaxID=51605 RepID=A0A7I8ITR0_SPIIN|nr:unnamed protein product [Spirodela intermedia]CAA6661404.1 unnamed protein product [Spirodela intermedia]